MVVRLKDLESGNTSPKKGLVRLSDLNGGFTPQQQQTMDQEQSDFAQMNQAAQTGAQIQADEYRQRADTQQLEEQAQMDAAQQTYADMPKVDEYRTAAHGLPVIGPVLRGLDAFSENPTVDKVAGVARSLYTPGASLGNIGAMTGVVERGLGRLAPNLGSTFGGRLAQEAIKEGAVGVPLGAGQSLASGNPDLMDAAKSGLIGGALGGVGGAAFPLIGRGIQAAEGAAARGLGQAEARPSLGAAVNDFMRNVDNAAPDAPGRNVLSYDASAFSQAGNELADRYRFINRDQFNDTQALPDPIAQRRYQEAVSRRGTPQYGEPAIPSKGNPFVDEALRVKPALPSPDEAFNAQYSNMTDAVDDLRKLDILIKTNETRLAKNPSEPLAQKNQELIQARDAIQQNLDELQGVTRGPVGEGLKREVIAAAPQVQPRVRLQATRSEPPVREAPKATGEMRQAPRQPVDLRETGSLQSGSAQPTSGIRANFKNQLDNGNFSPELQRKIKNTDQTYEKVTNQESLDNANEAVKNLPKAESDFLLNQSGGPDHIASGYRLMQKLDALGEHERALIVSKKLAEDLTKGGQTTQAAKILSRLSPEAQLLNLTRQAAKNGKTVTVADSVKFKELAKTVQENSGAGIRANQFTGILDRMAKGETIGAEDIKKLSDYLSSAEKNVTQKAVKVTDQLPNEFKEPRKRDKIISYLDDAEQAALARIAGRRGNLNSLPLGEWADHAIVVSSQIAKGTIKAATHVEDMVKLFGEEIRPVATQVFQKAQSLLKSVSPGISENDIRKADAAFKRISGQVRDDSLQGKIVEKYLKENPKVSPKDIDTLRELAKNVTRLSGDQRIDADIAMQKILNSYEKSSVWDKTLAIRYMSMLLNTSTQAINAVSGPIMATTGHVADVFGTMIDIAMHHALKTPRSTTLYGTNPLAFITRYLQGLKVGAKAGAQGVNPAGIQSSNEIRGLAFKSLYNPLGLAERALGAVSKGPDFAAYSAVYKSELIKQARVDAINKGIKGKANIDNHIQEFINDPPESAMLDADRIGKNTTFQRSDSTGGKIANYLNSAPPLVKPGVNAVIPFVRTPINMASSAVTMTPAGIIKGLFQLTSKSQASQREAIRTLSLGITGTGISALGLYLYNLGIITGANDSGDKDVDAIREQAGKGKYRFNQSGLTRYLSAMLNGDGSDAAEKAAKYQEGDHAFDYNKLQPLAFPLAIGAGLGQNKDKPLVGKLASAGSDAYGSLFGMSTLKGVQDVFQPQYGGTQGEKSLGVASRIAESFFKSFSPGGPAQEARRQDPIVRKTPYNNGLVEDVTGYFKSRTPGLSQSLPASKTTLGMNKMNAPGFSGQYANPYKSEVAAYSNAAVLISSLIDRTGDNSLAPSAPDKKVTGKDKQGVQVTIAIPSERYDQLQEEVGQSIIAKITALPQDLTDAKKAEKIKQIYSDVHSRERNKVKRELGIRVN